MAEENQQTNRSQEQPGEAAPALPLPRPYGHLPGSHSRPSSKREWPELVGLAAEEAERKIKEDMPEAQVQVVPPGNFVTMDFRRQRVRLFVDSSGIIKKAPKIG